MAVPRMTAMAPRRSSAHAVFDRSQTPSPTAPAETIHPAGAQKAGAGTSLLCRSAGSATHVTMYVTSRTMVAIVNAEMNVVYSAKVAAIIAVATMAATGVRK